MEFRIEGINIISEDFGSSYDDFWVNAEVDISKAQDHGAETFSFNIVSIERLKRVAESGPISGRGLIICKGYYDQNMIRNIIENLLKKINGKTWKEFCLEFEKYFEYV